MGFKTKQVNHIWWVNQIKKATKARFVSHLSEAGQNFIIAKYTNKQGGIDTFKYKIEGTPDELSDMNYIELLNILKNREQDIHRD